MNADARGRKPPRKAQAAIRDRGRELVAGRLQPLACSQVQLELHMPGAGGLAHGEARTFSFRRDGEELEGFLMRHGAALVAYVNKCPHWSVDLDMGIGSFYAPKVDRIFCRNHGALFEPTTGICDMGPCAGRGLEKLEVRVEGEDAVVLLPGAERVDPAG